MSRAQAGEELRLVIRTLEAGDHPVSISRHASVLQLKQQVAVPTSIASHLQRILYRGRELQDSQSLASLALPHGCILHMVERPVPATSAPRRPAAGGAAPQPTGMPNFNFNAIMGPMTLTPESAAMFQRFQEAQQAAAGTPDAALFGPFPVNMAMPAAINLNIGQPGGPPMPQGDDWAQSMNAVAQSLATMFGAAAPLPLGAVPGGGAPGRPAGAPLAHGPPGPLLSVPPVLGSDGQWVDRHAFEALHLMVRRLEDVNMEADPLPALPSASSGTIRSRQQAAQWAAAAATLVRSARTVLRGAQLNRETLAVVNRVLTAAGVQPVALGVTSFPVAAGDEDDGESYDDHESYWDSAESEEDAPESNEDSPESEQAELTQGRQAPVSVQSPSRPRIARPAAVAASDGGSSDDDVPSLADDSNEASDEDEMPRLLQEGSEFSDSDDGMPALVRRQHAHVTEDWYQDSEEENGSHSDSLPGLTSDTEDDDGPAYAPSAARPAAPAVLPVEAGPQAPAWFSTVSDDDFIILGAVTLGELTRRFLLAVGLADAPTSTNALLLRTSDHLRSLSALDSGREDILRSVRLLMGHLYRMSAVSAELARSLQHWASAMEDGNMELLQMAAGFISLEGNRPRPMVTGRISPNAGPMRPSVVSLFGPSTALPAAGGVPVTFSTAEPQAQAAPQVQVRATAAVGGSRGRGRRGRHSGSRGGAAVSGTAPRSAPVAAAAAATPGSAGSGIWQRAMANLSPDMRAGMMDVVSGFASSSQGVDGVIGQVNGVVDAMQRLSVTSLDVPAIANDIGAAVQQVVQQAASELQGTSTSLAAQADASIANVAAAAGAAAAAESNVTGAARAAMSAARSAADAATSTGSAARTAAGDASALAARVAPLVVQQVQQVLRRHMARLGQEEGVGEFAGALQSLLGINILTLGTEATATAGATPAAPAAPVAAAASPIPSPDAATAPPASVPATAAAGSASAPAATPAPVADAMGDAPRAPAPNPSPAQSSTAPSAAAAPRPSRPAGLGLGLGSGLQRRPRPAPTATPAVQEEDRARPAPAPAKSAALPPAAAGAAASAATTALPPSTAPPAAAPSALAASDSQVATIGAARRRGGGGGEGMGQLMQSLMQSPGLMGMARSPAMQQMAQQILGGGGGGGGLDIGSLMNAAGPMLSQMMGMPPPQSTGRALAAATSVDMHAALQELPEADAARWRDVLARDEAAQAAASPQAAFSAVYLAALPPHTAGGLLESLGLGGADG